MAFSDLSILSLMKTKMKWHQTRQKLLAENVANADTPNYQPKELKKPSFQKALQMQVPTAVRTAATHARHIQTQPLSSSNGAFRENSVNDWEVTPGGNAVVLENQMMKIGENQFEYQMASTIYMRSVRLIKTALGRQT